MLFDAGEKVHVAERRGFESDVRRHFVGEIIGVDQNAIAVRGRVFIFEGDEAGFQRHPEIRTRIVSLVDARMIINIIPNNTELEEITYQATDNGGLIVTDGQDFSMVVSEFGSRR